LLGWLEILESAMSNLATAMWQAEATARAANATPQLPVRSYFDAELFDAEMRLLFAPGPGYIGHELMVPGTGDYQVLSWLDDGHVLVRWGGGHDRLALLSNVCRHRQAIMLHGRGNAQNIVCPLHRWTYDLEGVLIGAPHFPENPCLNLRQAPLQSWNGLLFGGSRAIAADLAGMNVADFDFSGYLFDRVEIHECAYNWKTFIEVYLEDYHVVPFHPGLGNFVSCDDLRWQFGDRYSVQTVGVANGLARAGTKTYERWQQAVRAYYGDKQPPQGAIWLTVYPNIMLEWYPHVLVVSTLYPRGPQSTTNVVEFYYPEDIALFEREFVEAEQAAYMETAVEDDEIGLRMDAGRKALLEQGRNETGPYQSPMEDGMRHFHEFLRREMGDQYW
jgi:phenylpropionate dioxygenase-like ring-hydroxylating dioxygenase large terminal subunit